jgi:hypothetical protein
LFQQVDALGNDLLTTSARDDAISDLRGKKGGGSTYTLAESDLRRGALLGDVVKVCGYRGGVWVYGVVYGVWYSSVILYMYLSLTSYLKSHDMMISNMIITLILYLSLVPVMKVYGSSAVEDVVRASLAGMGLISEAGSSTNGGFASGSGGFASGSGGFAGGFAGGSEVDEASVQYVLQSLKQGAQSLLSTREEVQAKKGYKEENDFMRGVDAITLGNENNNNSSNNNKNNSKQSSASQSSAASSASASAAAAKVSADSDIKNIKSIFPHLGEGFIQACLDVYGGNMEEVVEALLLDNLNPKVIILYIVYCILYILFFIFYFLFFILYFIFYILYCILYVI